MIGPRRWHLVDGPGRNRAGAWHPTVIESTTGVEACGYSWCSGACGHPALVLRTARGEELKAYGSMVACGAVFQSWRVEWQGAKVTVTPCGVDEERLLRMMWW